MTQVNPDTPSMTCACPARIAILGAESSGKSSLAAALASHYDTLWVPEYLREFVEVHGRTPQEEDQPAIARRQLALEADALASPLSKAFVFCDTTPLMTALYSEIYFGRVDPGLQALADRHDYAMTIVTAPDSPWVADGLQRESPSMRLAVHQKVLAALAQKNIAYALVGGSLAHRLAQVSQLLADLRSPT